MLNKIFIPARDLLRSVPLYEFHIHTTYSDGKNTIEDYILRAIKERYAAICFTDHVDFTTNWFENYRNEIFNKSKKYNSLSIYCGIEVRAKDYKGNLNADMKILKESEIVIGVVHSIPSEDGKNKYDPKKFSAKKLLEFEYKATMGLLKNNLVYILGHSMSNYEKYFGAVPEEYYIRILEMAKKKDVVVELNPMYQQNFHKFLKLVLDVNPLISLGSNAHLVSEFGKAVEKVRELI